MAQIVGLKSVKGESKKTGKPFDAVIVSAVQPQREVTGLGVVEQFVDRPMFEAAAGGRSFEQLLKKECTFLYDQQGFLQTFSIA